ncbi:phosphoribosyl-AMP cyclohydrolase [Candidatus Peregrinibacteria bacterium]|nr:phosphoribosyl-AMP cyclohydrolase [Candidatus Peregrinibacteria bacterium]
MEECSMFRPNFEKGGGLIRAVAQDAVSLTVLMDAYMNEEAFNETVRTGQVVYFSRSKGKLWRKGEESGNMQIVRDIRVNCYTDSTLILAEQVGGAACHEGYPTCYYRHLANGELVLIEERVFDPSLIYKKGE